MIEDRMRFQRTRSSIIYLQSSKNLPFSLSVSKRLFRFFSFPRSSVGMPARALCARISPFWNAERSGCGFPRRAWEPAYEEQ